MTAVFDAGLTQAIVEARLAHLDALHLPVRGERVLEVGAGVGNMTRYFEERGCSVTSTDGRPANIAENLKRHPWRTVELADLEVPYSHDQFGVFGVVACFGVLYHVGHPDRCIHDLARVCQKFMVIETAVNGHDDNVVAFITEGKRSDQSLRGVGCRPGRLWIWRWLHEYFPYVYTTATQPAHDWFPLHWPAHTKEARAVFVASRYELPNRQLIDELPMEQGLETPI